VGFVVEKATLGQVFSECLCFPYQQLILQVALQPSSNHPKLVKQASNNNGLCSTMAQ
jgi:muramidase (phage lysozyme)